MDNNIKLIVVSSPADTELLKMFKFIDFQDFNIIFHILYAPFTSNITCMNFTLLY